jgi:hypothetical protein
VYERILWTPLENCYCNVNTANCIDKQTSSGACTNFTFPEYVYEAWDCVWLEVETMKWVSFLIVFAWSWPL